MPGSVESETSTPKGSVGLGGTAKIPTRRSWISRLAVSSFLAPVFGTVLAAIGLVVLAGNPDIAFGLGISEDTFQAILAGSSGLLAGAVVGLIGGVRGWQLTIPIFVTPVVGVAIYLAVVASNSDNGTLQVWAVWLGQSAAAFATTW